MLLVIMPHSHSLPYSLLFHCIISPHFISAFTHALPLHRNFFQFKDLSALPEAFHHLGYGYGLIFSEKNSSYASVVS